MSDQFAAVHRDLSETLLSINLRGLWIISLDLQSFVTLLRDKVVTFFCDNSIFISQEGWRHKVSAPHSESLVVALFGQRKRKLLCYPTLLKGCQMWSQTPWAGVMKSWAPIGPWPRMWWPHFTSAD